MNDLTIPEAVKNLKGNPYFERICRQLVEDREGVIRELGDTKDRHDLYKLSARTAAITDLLDLLSPMDESLPTE